MLQVEKTRCQRCSNYQPWEPDAGLSEGCQAEKLYADEAGQKFISEVNVKIAEYMQGLGEGCPYFKGIGLQELESFGERRVTYVLVSQGIEIHRTTDKEEAERMMKDANTSWREYVERCIEEGEPYADNEVFMYEE